MMSHQIICPKCHTPFVVDEAEYASIVEQVRNREFEDELNSRLEEQRHLYDAEKKADVASLEKNFEKKLSDKQGEIRALNEKLEGIAREKEKEQQLALATKDRERLEAISPLNNKIAELQAKVAQNALEQERAVARAQQEMKEKKDEEIRRLQDELERERNYKASRSTKMVGEDLEQFCHDEFDATRATMYPNAYFEKDNDASGGSKGDFIFRDYADARKTEEYVSIMFEMKNETDSTGPKHKNEDFFKKLDDDRRKKNCEFAVLVSTLEPDSNLYNKGIVDVSYRYPDMFVVRPEFFMSIIALLAKASRKSVALKNQLVAAQEKDADVTDFERKLEQFKKDFGINVVRYRKHFESTIKAIDGAIKQLNAIKEGLTGCDTNLNIADGKLEQLTIKKLTYKNPTMKAKFEEARKNGPSKPAEDFDAYEDVPTDEDTLGGIPIDEDAIQ
ncbi:MAG: DUF2130 domain-containing protein [Bacteroidales bacterium]|nr:DUF2130 domain-containing protein [Bacteroidales bacterium]